MTLALIERERLRLGGTEQLHVPQLSGESALMAPLCVGGLSQEACGKKDLCLFLKVQMRRLVVKEVRVFSTWKNISTISTNDH